METIIKPDQRILRVNVESLLLLEVELMETSSGLKSDSTRRHSSLLLLEVELMETNTINKTFLSIGKVIASIIGSGINGNLTIWACPLLLCGMLFISLLLLEVELMETFTTESNLVFFSTSLLLLEVELMETYS